MALQGTLETFALADVLRLLASTKKTGVLRIDGDRGHGEMSVVDGELVGANATGAPRVERPAEVLFELLRYETGSFVFDGDIEVAAGEHRVNVDEALADAEEQLREWRELESVVPSPTRLVVLIEDRDQEITLNPRQWAAVVALGGGATTNELSERLGVAELPATRLVRDLVEMGAAEIGEEASLIPSAAEESEGATVVVADLPTTLDPVADARPDDRADDSADNADNADNKADVEPHMPTSELPGDGMAAIPDRDEVPLDEEPAASEGAGLQLVSSNERSTEDSSPLTTFSLSAEDPEEPEEQASDHFELEDDGKESSLDDILAGAITPPPPPPPPAPVLGGDAPLSFADAPSLIDEPASPTSPADPPADAAPLFASDTAKAAFAPPPDQAFAEPPPPAFAAPPPPVDPPSHFASDSDPLSSWNDDGEDDDGLSGFHSDDDPVPLFSSSASSPGPDDPFGPDPFTIPDFSRSAQDGENAEEAAELARQLSNLSPRAQQAVAAAAAAGSDEERDQAIAQAEEASDEPINRSLLLKYLSSVDE